METVYYNFYAFEQAKASGGEDHRAVLVRKNAPRRQASGGNNVISLEDYRARHVQEQPGDFRARKERPEDRWEEEPEFSNDIPPRRERSGWREKLLAGLELAACGALIAAAVTACVVFLL